MDFAYKIEDYIPATYRQTLRDVTEQEGFPDNIAWPVSPSGL